MRIATYGEWNGNLTVEGCQMENQDNERNYTYNTVKNDEEVEVVLRLRPGTTNMIISITEQHESTLGSNLRDLKILDALRIGRIFTGDEK